MVRRLITIFHWKMSRTEGVNGNVPYIYIYKNSYFHYHSHWLIKQDNDKCRLCEAAPARKKLHFSKRTVELWCIQWIKQPHWQHLKYRNVNHIVCLTKLHSHGYQKCFPFQDTRLAHLLTYTTKILKSSTFMPRIQNCCTNIMMVML